MRILLTGGTGFLGRALCTALVRTDHEVTVLSRSPATVFPRCGPGVRALRSLDGWRSDTAFDAVIHLAGAPILDARWTQSRKRVLRESRVSLTDALAQRIVSAAHKPSVLLSASAVGYYGDSGGAALDEAAPPGRDFIAHLCAEWEAAAAQASAANCRVCLLRTGLVLHPGGGLLGRMLTPFKLGLGGPLGSGRQWMSWIHLDDWTALALRLLSDPGASGAFNLTAPSPVTNAAFTAALGRALHRPARLPVPSALLRLALGERAQLLLTGQRALPRRAETLGFRFAHPELEEALRSLLERAH